MCCRQFSLNLEVEFDNDPGLFGGSATNRKCTDILGLLIVILFFGAVVGLTVYCLLNCEVAKLTNGYDDSGNICGKHNKKYAFIKEDATKECVDNCTEPGTSLLYNYCVTDEKLIPYLVIMLQDYWIYIVICWFCGCFTGFCAYSSLNQFEKSSYDFPIVLFCLTALFCIEFLRILEFEFDALIFVVLIITVMIIWNVLFLKIHLNTRNSLKFKLTYNLIREAWKIIKALKIFWLLPFLSSVLVTGSILTLNYCWIFLQTFSYQKDVGNSNEPKIKYVQDLIATITGALLIYGFILFYEIVKNCQCFIVGGCVTQWYFTRRGGEVFVSSKRTITNLLKYHLGSVCCTSLLLPIIYVVRAIINGIKGAASGYNKESIYTCSCRLLSETCLATYITCLNFFTQNGLVMTAMYGCSYCKGTSRAHKLLYHNNFNAAELKTFGDWIVARWRFVSFMVFTVFGAGIICILNDTLKVKQQFIILLSFVILCQFLFELFVCVIDVTIDTLFLCFCEDCQYNNGTSKPYCMSPNFARFIENANKYANAVSWKNVEESWQKGPKRLY